jgi:uncharacterized membrane protein
MNSEVRGKQIQDIQMIARKKNLYLQKSSSYRCQFCIIKKENSYSDFRFVPALVDFRIGTALLVAQQISR